MNDQTLLKIDEQCAMRYPGYRNLSPDERGALIAYAVNNYYPDAEYLGNPISIIAAIVGIVGTLITSGIAISNAVRAKRTAETVDKRSQAAAEIEQQAAEAQALAMALNQEAQDIEDERKQKLYITAGVAGMALLAATFLL